MAMSKFSFRWGIPLLDDATQYVPVYRFMLRHYAEAGVSREEFLCITHLADYHYESANGKAAPSLGTIAKQMGYKHENSVRNLIKEMEGRELVKVTRRSGYTSEYDFSTFAALVLRLWQLSNEEAPLQPNVGVGVHPIVGLPLQPNVPEEKETKKKKLKEEWKKAPAANGPVHHPSLDKHPAVLMVQDVTEMYPEKALWHRIAATVGLSDIELQRWREAMTDWIGHGWYKGNVSGMLDVFQKGGVAPRNGQPAPVKPSGNYDTPEADYTPPIPFKERELTEDEKIWDAAYRHLSTSLPGDFFPTWIKSGCNLAARQDNTFVLEVRDARAYKQLTDERIVRRFANALTSAAGMPIEVVFTLADAAPPAQAAA
jgi:hypothetical protein